MGTRHSTYVGYGVRILGTTPEQIKGAELPDGVGYLLTGERARNMIFLTIECNEIGPGDYAYIRPNTVTENQRAAWSQTLRMAAAGLGAIPKSDPGWFVVPDPS